MKLYFEEGIIIKQLIPSKPQNSFVVWIIAQITILFATILIIGYVLDTANILNFTRLSIAISIVILILVIYNYKMKFKFNKTEIIHCSIVFVIFFLIGIKPILPTFYPINHSVDFVHHYSLINYIYEHQSLVKQAQGNLGEMYRYPFGADLIQAYISWLTGINTLKIGHIFLTIVFALTSLTFYGILNKIFINRIYGNIVALCSPFIILILKEYSLIEYWEFYHSSQMLGTFIILSSMLILSEINDDRFLKITLSLSSITLLLTFPLWIAIFNFFILFYILFSKQTKIKKILNLILLIIPQFIAFSLFYMQGYVSSSIEISGINGETTKPSITSLGGYIFIILFLIGIIFMFINIKSNLSTSVNLIFYLACTGVIIQFIAFKVLVGFGFGSDYMIIKTFFLAKYFYVGIIAYAFLEISKYIKLKMNLKIRNFITLTLLFAMFLVVFSFIPKRPLLIEKDVYNISLQAKSSKFNNKTVLFPYPESPITSYLIYTGIWEEDRFLNPMSANYLFNKNIPSIWEWITSESAGEYALIGNVRKQLEDPNLLKYVKIIKSEGDCAIVKRINGEVYYKSNKIKNPSFENIDDSWTMVKYSGANIMENYDTNLRYDGNQSMYINGNSINAGISQKIKVESNKIYKISVWCRGEGVMKKEGYGAFMSIEGSKENLVEWPDDSFDWQKREMIINTKNLSEINLVLGLGAYGSASGKVWFDKTELYELDLPE